MMQWNSLRRTIILRSMHGSDIQSEVNINEPLADMNIHPTLEFHRITRLASAIYQCVKNSQNEESALAQPFNVSCIRRANLPT